MSRSDVIAVVHINAGTDRFIAEIDNGCGFAYEAFVGVPVKGIREGERIAFRTPLPLMMSGSYLVFLSDVILDEDARTGTFGADIRSELCEASGISLTTVEYLESDSMSSGPEVILERRRQKDKSNKRVEYFFASTRLEELFRHCLDTEKKFVTHEYVYVQRATHVSQEIAFRANDLLDMLREAFAIQ